MHLPPPPHEIIDAYLAGELGGPEADRVLEYLVRHPGRRGFMAGMRAAAQSQDRVAEPPDANAAAAALLARIDQQAPLAEPIAAQRSMRMRVGTLKGVAGKPATRPRRFAVVAGIVAATVAAVVAVIYVPGPSPDVAASAYTVSTRRGEQVSTTLPDGTRVILAPASTIAFTANATGERLATLDGQAYFSVVHDDARPFAVKTRVQTTRVLGTAFVVRSYSNDAMDQVAVAEGKVAIDADDRSTILLPGDVGRITSGETPHVTRDAKTGDIFGWMRGEVAFDNASLAAVAAELERLYDLEVTFATPSLAQRKVTITIAGESAQTLLDVIAVAVDANVTRQGRTVRFIANEQ